MVQKFLYECEDFLRESCPGTRVRVTGGPYRTWDVNVIQDGDNYVVDLYTSMRSNGNRVRQALEYAVRTIRSHHMG